MATFAENWKQEVNIPTLLESLGEDLEREGLTETPRRVGQAWKDFLIGYTMNPEEILSTTFEAEGNGFQACRNIRFASLCEHHFLAFHGTVAIVYQPDKRVCGLSKLTRLVDCFGRRLQIQERMTQQIADALFEYLEPKGVFVIVRATHLCCASRGIQQEEMTFNTSASCGELDMQAVQLLLTDGDFK